MLYISTSLQIAKHVRFSYLIELYEFQKKISGTFSKNFIELLSANNFKCRLSHNKKDFLHQASCKISRATILNILDMNEENTEEILKEVRTDILYIQINFH